MDKLVDQLAIEAMAGDHGEKISNPAFATDKSAGDSQGPVD